MTRGTFGTIPLMAVAIGLMSGCTPGQSPPSQPAGQPAVDVAPPPSSTAPTDVMPPSATSTAAPTDTQTLLFDFHQDGDAAAFVPPTTILFRRATHGPPACRTELRGGGNMWSAADVQSAFHLADVTFTLQSASTFQADRGGARLTAPGYPGSIKWVAKCADCPPEPQGVKHFRQVMQTVVDNRRELCP